MGIRSPMNGKVRWVRCPKCRQILPELPEFSVYKCGGCDTVLQAKSRKRDGKQTGECVHEADTTRENDLKNISEDDKVTIASTYESDLDEISKNGDSGTDCKGDSLGGAGQCINQQESSCIDGISCDENNATSSAEAKATEETIPSEQCEREDGNESRDICREHLGGLSVSSDISSSSEFIHHENETLVPASQMYKNESLFLSTGKVTESRNSSENKSDRDPGETPNRDLELPLETKEVSSSDFCTSNEIEDPSQLLAGVDREVEETMNSHSSAKTFLEMAPEDEIGAAQSSSSESVSADYVTCPCTESEKLPHNGFQRVSSADTLENLPRVYTRSELGVTLKSPTAKSYYGYDAGASSCHDTDDKVSNRRSHLTKRNFRAADPNNVKQWPKRDDFMMNQVMSTESEPQLQQMNSSSSLPEKKHLPSDDNKWHQDEYLEPTRYRQPVRNIMRMERKEYQSRLPFYSNGSHVGYRNETSSFYGQNNLFEMPGKPPEVDKLELLRMVYELQGQLNKTNVLNVDPHGRFSKGVAKKEEQLLFQERGAPLSGQTAVSRHLISCLCLRCRRQERFYSAQLPPRVAGSNKGHSMAYQRQNYYRPYHSASSSPKHYYFKPSLLPLWSRDTKSYDHMHNDQKVKKKQPTAMQHVMPIAGGSPIIACYRCSEILQVPADFFLFKRRYHRLKCSACSEVLKFSLDKKRRLAPVSSITDCPHGEPVSFSDDYDKSFCISCSTEGDNSTLIPTLEIANGVPDRRKMSSSSSLESKKDGKKSIIVEEFLDEHKNHGRTFDAAGPSSEVEEVAPSSGSQLHQLMGYSSPTRLIYRYSDYSTVESD